MTPQMKLLIDELANDPLTRVYSGMTAKEAADSLNADNRTRPRDSITGAQLYEAVDDGEFGALSAENQQRIRDIWSLGQIDVRPGTKARSVVLSLFGAGTTTRSNLTAAAGQAVSRGHEIGAKVPVKPGHIEEARRLIGG